MTESHYCATIKLFGPCLILKILAGFPFGLTERFSVSWWYATFILMPITLVLKLLWCEHGSVSLSEHSQFPSGAEAHWSSWLHNNASQSVNSYASSPVKDRLPKCSPCQNTVVCGSISLQYSLQAWRGRRSQKVGKGVLFNHPESHISCPSADETEQADSPEAW